jgi:hypothetical protein
VVKRLDEFGFRWASFEPMANTKNILLIGDSFVHGVGLSDMETFAYKLNSFFKNKEYQFYNAGISGQNIVGYLKNYKRIKRDLPFSFDRVIVFVYLGNDIINYSNLAAVKKITNQVEEGRTVIENAKYYIKSIFPNIVLAVSKLSNKERTSKHGEVDLYVSWINEHLDYYNRSLPITDLEKSIMNDRFMRIESKIREAMKHDMVNPYVFRSYVAPPSLNDYIFNMNSHLDNDRFISSMEVLSEFIGFVEEDIDVVLIPSRFQVSIKYREYISRIMGGNYPANEFSNLFEINRYIAEWFEGNYKHVRLIDLTNDIIADADGSKYYYWIDGHFNVHGSNLVVQRISSYLTPQSTAMD